MPRCVPSELPQLVRSDGTGKNAFAGNLDLIQNVKVQLCRVAR